jgi:hypothetical protein
LAEHIKFDADETHRMLACLTRAEELARETDNLDIVAMAGELMDLIIEKWMRRNDA